MLPSRNTTLGPQRDRTLLVLHLSTTVDIYFPKLGIIVSRLFAPISFIFKGVIVASLALLNENSGLCSCFAGQLFCRIGVSAMFAGVGDAFSLSSSSTIPKPTLPAAPITNGVVAAAAPFDATNDGVLIRRPAIVGNSISASVSLSGVRATLFATAGEPTALALALLFAGVQRPGTLARSMRYGPSSRRQPSRSQSSA